MKRRISTSLIAITCFSVLCPITANADNPLDKLIPRGTFFKKLKEEFTGVSDKVKIPTPRRAPTPAPIDARPDDRRQATAQQPIPRQMPQHQSSQRQQPRRQPALATRPLPPMNNPRQAPTRDGRPVQHRAVQSSGTSASAGFGAVVQMAKNNQLIVTRLHPQGNAIKAGLKPGDIVKAVGSVKLTSADEYEQITNGLKPGDQMEFEFVRRGHPQKALIPFGKAPEVQAATINSAPPTLVPTEAYVDSDLDLEGVPSVLDNSIQPAARVSQLPATASSVVTVPRATEKRLQRTIESQRAKMERMEQELEMLRKTNAPAIRPTENNWALPELSSPN